MGAYSLMPGSGGDWNYFATPFTISGGLTMPTPGGGAINIGGSTQDTNTWNLPVYTTPAAPLISPVGSTTIAGISVGAIVLVGLVIVAVVLLLK